MAIKAHKSDIYQVSLQCAYVHIFHTSVLLFDLIFLKSFPFLLTSNHIWLNHKSAYCTWLQSTQARQTQVECQPPPLFDIEPVLLPRSILVLRWEPELHRYPATHPYCYNHTYILSHSLKKCSHNPDSVKCLLSVPLCNLPCPQAGKLCRQTNFQQMKNFLLTKYGDF